MNKLFFLLLVFVLLFGCNISSNIDENDFLKLKSDYSMSDSFNPDLVELNSYLNELSDLRGQSNDLLARVIDFEIASTQTFVNFSKALESSKKINYYSNHCNTIDYKETIKYLNLAIKYSEQANSIILLPTDLSLLRENQGDVIREMGGLAKELLNSITGTC